MIEIEKHLCIQHKQTEIIIIIIIITNQFMSIHNNRRKEINTGAIFLLNTIHNI
jgi:hypothetical protein